MTARLTRRSFLALGAVVVAGGAAAVAKLLEDGGAEWTGDAATVAELVDDPEAVRDLGEAYLAQGGRPGPLDTAVERALRARDAGALRRAVRARAAQEASADELISVNGWLVAPTEARVAALLAVG